jgi:hypothetical protein
VAGTDSPTAIPEEFHEALVYGAAVRSLAGEAEASDRVDAFQDEYQSLLGRMRAVLIVGTSGPYLIGGRGPRRSRWGLA